MDGTVFAFDPDWVSTLNAPFMTNAFLAGLCIALAAGVMGYFTIARHSTFAAHAGTYRTARCHRSRHCSGLALFPSRSLVGVRLSAEHW